MGNTKIAIEEISQQISNRIFIKVAKWNLYLGDAGLAKDLAIECVANINGDYKSAIKKSLENIFVELGGGKTKISLDKLITSPQIFDLEDILSSYYG